MARTCRKQGIPEALYDLGEIYYFGDHGEPKDPARALAYFQQSAATDYAPAQNALGVMFRDGLGVQRDMAKAAT